MSWRSATLRTQFAGAMIAAIGLAILFGYVGLNLYAHWEEMRTLSQLDPVSRTALQALREGRAVPSQDLIDLCRASLANADKLDRDQDRVLVMLACLASAVGVGVGMVMARRLARPIEAVSGAARLIASGNLAARAHSQAPGAGELAQLLEDFNAMAASLEAFDQDVRESSAAIAHELRTPLTILRGRLQGFLDGLFVVDNQEIRSLITQVDILSRIVEDLRTLSMAQTGQLDLKCRPVDIATLADRHLRAIGGHLDAAGLKVRTELGSAPVMADPQRMTQILTILAENVVRHAAAGGEITLRTTVIGDEAVIELCDRGPGLPNDHSHLFDRFWRGEPSRNRAHGGTGLGLAIARAIVEAHGGRIEARNRQGGGACFSIHLPVKS